MAQRVRLGRATDAASYRARARETQGALRDGHRPVAPDGASSGKSGVPHRSQSVGGLRSIGSGIGREPYPAPTLPVRGKASGIGNSGGSEDRAGRARDRRQVGSPGVRTGACEDLGVELWATRGTGRNLTDAGVPVRSVEELTGVADWFNGRVKTLHPAVFGGILAPRNAGGPGRALDPKAPRFRPRGRELLSVRTASARRPRSDRP